MTVALPDRFGLFGGRYVPETLIPALEALNEALQGALADPAFAAELDDLLRNYVGRPSPLSDAPRLSAMVGAPVYLKREDLNHTGAHKINNTVGQALLARRMGKRRIIAETGAGQHGVATATICARFGLECVVYMGAEDMRRQELNVYRMRLMGATVVPVESGTRTLKDATTEAIRDWVTNVTDSHYIIGSVVGPAPYPRMVREFQSIIGREAREQILARAGRLAANRRRMRGRRIECHGHLLGIRRRRQRGTDRGRSGRRGPRNWTPRGIAESRDPGRAPRVPQLSAPRRRRVRCIQRTRSRLDSTIPGVGPEHAFLKDSGRATYVAVTDAEALSGFEVMSRAEGIIPALETAHAVAWLVGQAGRWNADDPIVLCVSGRGDKDVAQVSALGVGRS